MIGGVTARHTITVVRAPLVDDVRGAYRDWSNAAESASDGWAIETGAAGEDTTNRDGSSTEYTLRGPFAADIEATDRVRLFGDLYQVSGGVLRQPGATALTSHAIVRLTRWEG